VVVGLEFLDLWSKIGHNFS